MSVVVGVVGTVYHCSIDGGTYRITGSRTCAKVNDPASIKSAQNTFISNWRAFSVGGGGGRPAGMPPPVNAHQPTTAISVPGGGSSTYVKSGNQFTSDELIGHFMSEGFTKAGAIGIVANLIAENGLRTSGPRGGQGEEGLAQWKGDRLNNLKRYAADHHLNWQSKEAQLGYLDHELATNYPGLYAKIKHATNAEAAAQDFCAGFEMPTLDNGTPNYQTYASRRQIAAKLAGNG